MATCVNKTPFLIYLLLHYQLNSILNELNEMTSISNRLNHQIHTLLKDNSIHILHGILLLDVELLVQVLLVEEPPGLGHHEERTADNHVCHVLLGQGELQSCADLSIVQDF